jgi:hypothetical protein
MDKRIVIDACRRELDRLLPGSLRPHDVWLKAMSHEGQLAVLAWAERVPSSGEVLAYNYIPRAPLAIFRWVEKLAEERDRSGCVEQFPNLYLNGFFGAPWEHEV